MQRLLPAERPWKSRNSDKLRVTYRVGHIKLQLCVNAVCQIEIQFCVFCSAGKFSFAEWLCVGLLATTTRAFAPLCFICICALMGFYVLSYCLAFLSCYFTLGQIFPSFSPEKKKTQNSTEKWKQVLLCCKLSKARLKTVIDSKSLYNRIYALLFSSAFLRAAVPLFLKKWRNEKSYKLMGFIWWLRFFWKIDPERSAYRGNYTFVLEEAMLFPRCASKKWAPMCVLCLSKL